jgi:hypothetical protein
MLFMEIAAVHSEDHRKRVSTFCVGEIKNVLMLNQMVSLHTAISVH